MSGHGHVTPNKDGSKMRCGGPGLCATCSLERSRLQVQTEKAAGKKPKPYRVELGDVYSYPDEGYAERLLYRLLGERRPYQAISHKVMPSFDEHCAFVKRRPYRAWYLIEAADGSDGLTGAPYVAGSIYLTEANEVGLFVFERHQKRGIGERALRQLRFLHPGERLLANIAPANAQSHLFFQRMGFKPIQTTYELVP